MSQEIAAPASKPSVGVGSVLDLLSDDDTRELFERAGERRTIPELAAECELPRSTAYRKVNRLVEAELLEPATRAAGGTGKATEYRRTVGAIEIEIDDGTTIDFSV